MPFFFFPSSWKVHIANKMCDANQQAWLVTYLTQCAWKEVVSTCFKM